MRALEMPTQTTNHVKLSMLHRTLVRVTSAFFVVVMIAVAAMQADGQESSRSRVSTVDPEVLRQQFEEKMKLIRASKANSVPSTDDEADSVIPAESSPVRSASNSRRSTSFDIDTRIQQAAFQQVADSPAASQTAQFQASPLRSTPNQTRNEPSLNTAMDSEKNKPAELFLDLSKEQKTTATAEPGKPLADKVATEAVSANPLHILTRAVAWIVVALCLLSLTVLGVRRWQRQRGLLPTTNARSRVLETLSLGPGRTVSLIELAGFRALVASDAGGIRSLVLTPTSFQDEFAIADKELTYDSITMTEV